MVGRIACPRSRIRWLQAHGILGERYLTITETYVIYRILKRANAPESAAPFVPATSRDLPPDLYRVSEGTPVDMIFRRLVHFGCAEVHLGPYVEHVCPD